MTRYAAALTNTPQTEQADPRQVKNSAGGYTFQLDVWSALDRWLILGAEGGTYYAAEKQLALENARTIQVCLKEDGKRTVERIVEISKAGRAPKNDPAIFALALACAQGNDETRQAAFAAVPEVCRIGTHLFQFAESVNALRGWGRGLRRAVSRWYAGKTPEQLAYQVAKYRQRGGWSHRDLLRLAHPSQTDDRAAIYRWIAAGKDGLGERRLEEKGSEKVREYEGVGALPEFLAAFEELQGASNKTAVQLIRQHRFTHEMVPTELKQHDAIWRALLEHMPMTALIRNLGALTARGILQPLSEDLKSVLAALGDAERIRKARVHPIAVLGALTTYEQGHGARGKLSWTPVEQVVDALNEAFYTAFGNVEKTGKRTLLALDVSGSMAGGWGPNGGMIAGIPGLSPAKASAVMAMVRARVEDEWHIFGFANRFRELKITPKMRLDQVMKEVDRHTMGTTDCGLPMLYAMQNKLDVEAFEVYTDNETYAGQVHPHQAMRDFRKARNPQATLAVVGCTATDFTIADPNDAGMLDVVGFDTATPNLIAAFQKGW